MLTIHLSPLAAVIGIMSLAGFVAATWKLFRFIFKVDRALPTLLTIAEQFQNNGGTTLKDSIDKIRDSNQEIADSFTRRADELQLQDRVILGIAEDSRTIANTNAAIVKELATAQSDEIHHIREYLHERMHDLKGELTKIVMQVSLSDKRAERLEKRLDALMPYVVRSREDGLDAAD